jgi:hypothetical protein
MARDAALQVGDVAPLDADRFLPAGVGTLLFRDWTLAPGCAISSEAGAKFKYVLGLKKNPQVGRVGRGAAPARALAHGS